MSSEVTTAKSTGLGALSALKTGLTNVRTKLPEVGGSPYLRLLKDGDWVFGQEDNVVTPGTEAIVNPLSIRHGYASWTNRQPGEGKNEKKGEIMVGLNQTLPPIHELEKHVDEDNNDKPCPWKDQLAIDVKFLTGKHKGTQVVFNTTSVGGLNAGRGVLDAILEKLEEATEFVCPIIRLDSDSYKHNTYGKTYVPVMEVIGWANLQGEEEDSDVVSGPDAVKRVEKTPEPEAESEGEDARGEAPPRRRRRA